MSESSDALLLRACRRLPVDRTPVWFMRQAGRSLPEYRAARQGTSMLTACATPDLVSEITLQPVRRHGVDAAILFSDIVVPLHAIGIDLDIVANVGPIIASPIRTSGDLASLRALEPDDVSYVAEAVGNAVSALGDTPLIGFAGAPFTLASYLVEGGPSRTLERTKALMYAEPATWHALLAALARLTLTFLEVQVRAGASAVQLFDSWVGALSAADYREYVVPHTAAVLSGLAGYHVPRIHFGIGTGELLGLMGGSGVEVVGVDWRVPLGTAAERVGPARALQGNLDPAVLLAPWAVVEREVRRVLSEATAVEGHVFNLGHGVLPSTDPGVLTRVVDLVHSASQAGGAAPAADVPSPGS